MRMKISEIIQASGGKLLCGNPETVVTDFITDSRQGKKGAMFVPIKGEKMDSHDFIDAVLAGETAASFTEKEIEGNEKPVILVNSAIKALQKTAEYYRKKFDIPIIGVTGSVGKTTTKEMVALALSSKLKVMRTEGNQNSQVGVAKTIFTLKKSDDAAVVEMGISMPGEMEKISKIARVNYAVISNIGISHIEHLKSQENILNEKFKIADYIKEDGKVFVNGDDDLLFKLKNSCKTHKIVTFGINKGCDWRAEDIKATEKGTFFSCICKGKKINVFVPAPGIHNVRNALAALAVASELGVPCEDAIRAIASYKPPKMRQEILEINGSKIIDDTYNASPDSVKAGIDILASIETTGKRIAVLGDMFELGDYAEISHFESGRYAKEKNIDMLVCVGEMAKETVKGFENGEHKICVNNKQAIEFLNSNIKSGDVVLIKGSRGMKMDEIVKSL